MRVTRIAARLNNTKWGNKYLQIEAKTKIYKVAMRPIMTYTADTTKAKRMLVDGEMKVFAKNSSRNNIENERSENNRRESGVENINEWVLKRKRSFNIAQLEASRNTQVARAVLNENLRGGVQFLFYNV